MEATKACLWINIGYTLFQHTWRYFNTNLLWFCVQASCIRWWFSWVCTGHSFSSVSTLFNLNNISSYLFWAFFSCFQWTLVQYFLWSYGFYFVWVWIFKNSSYCFYSHVYNVYLSQCVLYLWTSMISLLHWGVQMKSFSSSFIKLQVVIMSLKILYSIVVLKYFLILLGSCVVSSCNMCTCKECMYWSDRYCNLASLFLDWI